jgi:hypothetical protein
MYGVRSILSNLEQACRVHSIGFQSITTFGVGPQTSTQPVAGDVKAGFAICCISLRLVQITRYTRSTSSSTS